jgi:hypothetical protein
VWRPPVYAEVAALRDHWMPELAILGIRPCDTDRLAIRDLLRMCRLAETMRRSGDDG